MVRVGAIFHPNKIVDEKVKAFYDYLHYSLSRRRDITTFTLENHYTIIDRLRKRIGEFLGHKSTKAVIRHYLENHQLLNTKKDRIIRAEKPEKLVKQIQTYWYNNEFAKIRHPFVLIYQVTLD